MFLHIIQRIRTYANSRIHTWNLVSPLNLSNTQHQQTTAVMHGPHSTTTPCTSTTTTSSDPETRNAMWRSLRAALRGDKDAQYQMGISYLHGNLGLDRSYSHAEKWLDQAAQQGHPAARHTLEHAYNRLAFS